MPKNKYVLMNIEGVDFYINDSLFKHFNSLQITTRSNKTNNDFRNAKQ